MERIANQELLNWFANANRKPLILRGARQVGKTWIAKDFAKKQFGDNWVYVNFEEDNVLQNVFENDFDIKRILRTIGLRKGVRIKEDTLLIFDEIQSARRGVMSLKYFCENARTQPVIAAGSLLGISFHNGDSFPVGKVDFVDLEPLNFREFLMANDCGNWLDVLDKKDWNLLSIVKDQLIDSLRIYYYVGGMPEVVQTYINTHDMQQVRNTQLNILNAYCSDFSKHAPGRKVPRIKMVWDSIVGQLSKENKRFVFNVLKEGARAKDFVVAIEWLVEAGLVRKVKRTKCGELPLNAFEDFGAFKLFSLDIGLLCAQARLSSSILVEGDDLFATFKGALTEQYVCQQLSKNVDFMYYWSADNSIGKLDFLIQKDGKVIPIEVKAAENLKSKSLSAFVKRYDGMKGVRFSMSDYREQDWMKNIPLYALAGNLSL